MRWFRQLLLTTVASLGLVLATTAAGQAQSRASRTPARSRSSQGQVLSLEKAQYVFRVMASQKDIAFRFPRDGCYARAYLMVQRMKRLGVRANKVWAFAYKGQKLFARTSNDPRGYVTWRYHVAPYVVVRSPSGRLVNTVIDPSMFTGPVSVHTWVQAQKRNSRTRSPFLCKTRPGQAPHGPYGRKPGTGYWPADDPRHGKAYHARRVMKLYKPYEGRTAPKSLTSRVRKL
jgi:hypothetical protein